MSKKYDTHDSYGISVRDVLSLEPELLKKKYKVIIELKFGRIRYLYLNDSNLAEYYVKIIGAKILKVITQ